jgi:hypothetical protein
VPFTFTKQCAGDIGIIAFDDDGTEYMAAMLFFRAAGGYPVFDIYAGGEPTLCNTLPEALNHMVSIAQAMLTRGLPK